MGVSRNHRASISRYRVSHLLVKLFLIKLVRISGFSSLFSAIAVFLAPSGKECAENTAIARKREEKPEILTNLMRKRLTRLFGKGLKKKRHCAIWGTAAIVSQYCDMCGH